MNLHVYWAWLIFVSGSPLHAQTPIYRCVVEGVATFTDRPCDAQAAPIELDTSRVSTFAPVPAGKVNLPQAKRPKSHRAEPMDKKKDRCASIHAGLRKIDDRLRAGYSAREGVKLEDRKRDLRQQARGLGCR